MPEWNNATIPRVSASHCTSFGLENDSRCPLQLYRSFQLSRRTRRTFPLAHLHLSWFSMICFYDLSPVFARTWLFSSIALTVQDIVVSFWKLPWINVHCGVEREVVPCRKLWPHLSQLLSKCSTLRGHWVILAVNTIQLTLLRHVSQPYTVVHFGL